MPTAFTALTTATRVSTCTFLTVEDAFKFRAVQHVTNHRDANKRFGRQCRLLSIQIQLAILVETGECSLGHAESTRTLYQFSGAHRKDF